MELGSMCRVCSEIKADVDLENMFSEINLKYADEKISWIKIIENYCRVEIFQIDLVPQNICTTCKKNLLHVVYTITLCQKSDTILRDLYNKSIKVTEQLKTDIKNLKANNIDDEVIESDAKVKYMVNSTNISQKSDDKLLVAFETKTNLVPISFQHSVAYRNLSMFSNQFTNLPINISNTDNNVERPHKCNQCIMKFKLKSHLVGHQRNVHEGIKTHYCNECDKSFFGSAQLKIHMMKHSKEYPFLCAHCGKRFAQKCYLKVHLKIHSGIKDFKCDYCSYVSGNRGALQMHIKGVHRVDKKHQCSNCGTRFMYPSGLAEHMKIHTGTKRYQCSICTKMFRTVSNLKEHNRTHSGEKPYKCRHCEKTFKITGHRMVHERIHTGEKPYTCTVCEKKFYTKSNLNCHRKTHEKVS